MNNLNEAAGIYDKQAFIAVAMLCGPMTIVCFFRTFFAAMDVMTLRKNNYAEQINIFYTNEEFYKKRVEDLYIQGGFLIIFLSLFIVSMYKL